MRTRVGLRGIAVVSPLLRIAAALTIAAGPPFPVLLAINVVFSLGSGLTDMAWNNVSELMGKRVNQPPSCYLVFCPVQDNFLVFETC
jgi:hypothetical protein